MHMYCVIYDLSVCIGKRLDLVYLLSSERKGCQATSEMSTAVGANRACTSWNLVAVLGSTWVGANTMGSVCKRRTK